MKKFAYIVILSLALILASCNDAMIDASDDEEPSGPSSIGEGLMLSSSDISIVSPFSFRSVSSMAKASGGGQALDILAYSADNGDSGWVPVEFDDGEGRHILIMDPVVYPVDSSSFFCRTGKLVIAEEKPVVTVEHEVQADGSVITVPTISMETLETIHEDLLLYVDIVDNEAWVLDDEAYIALDSGYFVCDGSIYLKVMETGGTALYSLDKDNPSAGLRPLTSASFDVGTVVAYSDEYIIATRSGKDDYGYIIDVSGRYPYASAPKETHKAVASYVHENGVGEYEFEYMTGKLVNAMITPSGTIYDIYGIGNEDFNPYYNESAVITACREGAEFTFAEGEPEYIPLCSEIYGLYEQMFLAPRTLRTFTDCSYACNMFYSLDNDSLHPAIGELMADDSGNVRLRSVVLPEGTLHGAISGSFKPSVSGHTVTFISTEYNAIFIVDLEAETYRTIETGGRVADEEITFSEDGTAIFHQYVNATDIGTYRMNINDASSVPELISIDKMDLYQVLPLEDL